MNCMSTCIAVIIVSMNIQNKQFHLVGGRLCLDFLNTANWNKLGTVATEKLESEADITRWCRAIGKIEYIQPQFDDALLESLQEFRALLRHIFLSVINKGKLTNSDLKALNLAGSHLSNSILCIHENSIRFDPTVSLKQIVLFSAVPILTSQSEITRVKMCGGDNCGWLFLDESKNRRRRWCSMEMCGNREKARRHYKRKIALAHKIRISSTNASEPPNKAST